MIVNFAVSPLAYMPQIVVLTCLFALLTTVCILIYNRYLHPLAHIPGPFWGSLTELYKFFVLSSIPTLGLELHKKYGPLVRIAPNLVIFNDPKLLPEVYHRKADKTSWYESWMWGNGVQAMFLTPKYEAHAAKKRVVGPACSLKALKDFEHRFDDRIEELCHIFEHRFAANQIPVDFAEWLRYFLSDTFNHLAYGKATDCVRHGKDVGGHIDAIQSTYYTAAVVASLPWFFLPIVKNRFVQSFVLPYTPYGKNMAHTFSNFADKYAQKQETGKRGFLDVIRNHLSEAEIRAEHVTFTAATLDGVAAFISPFIDNLIQNPRVLDLVLKELNEAQQRGTLSTPVAKYDEIVALPYFQACIKESLRRDAPAQTLLPRVVGNNGLRYQDVFLPTGTEMATSPYFIHRNPEIFGESPEIWRPERWLDGSTDVSKMLKYGMWWGYGERKCAGEHYAQLEMQKLCFELVRRFHITCATPERFRHEKWAVGMYWEQWLSLVKRI